MESSRQPDRELSFSDLAEFRTVSELQETRLPGFCCWLFLDPVTTLVKSEESKTLGGVA